MHMQVVTFQLEDMTDAEFRAPCDEVAPAFAVLPGLISKVWLADEATGTYDGIYTWETQDAYEAYTASGLFNAIATNPKFTNISSRDSAVIEAPTWVTRGITGAAV
jgi:hypothetical protein